MNIEHPIYDIGEEYFPNGFEDFESQNSIKHKLTSRYVTQQNEIVERSTIFDIAESHLPKYLSIHVVMHGAYIGNRCVSQHTQNTPYCLINNATCFMKCFTIPTFKIQ